MKETSETIFSAAKQRDPRCPLTLTQAILFEVQSSSWAPFVSWPWLQRLAGKFFAWRGRRKHARYSAFHRRRAERLGGLAPDCPPPSTEAEIISQLRAELRRLRTIVERQPGWEEASQGAGGELAATAAVVMENAEHFERVVCDLGLREGSAVVVEESEEIAACACSFHERARYARGVLLRLRRGHAIVNIMDDRGVVVQTRNVPYFFICKPEDGQP